MPNIASYIHQHILLFWRYLVLIALIFFPPFHASNAGSHLKAIISANPGSSSASLDNIKLAWVAYLNKRVAEWKVFFTFACVLVALSLTIFQIPQAANDPFTYTFASLAQFRALFGLVYAAMLSAYFESEYTRTAKFAEVWWKTAVEAEGKIWNTWIMLSLPAASTLWALVFYLFAILNFTLHPATDGHPMPLSFVIPLRVAIAGTTLSDLICFSCMWVTLKGYTGRYYTPLNEEV